MNRYERLNEERKIIEKRKRVAAYCRVSTDNEDQANSFESQQRYFRQYIERNPDWELYEIFADEGISGTSTKKRKEFNRMIACAKNGDFDLIITKEISRFARNTLDSIYYTRDLKKHGVGVIFMNDNINTLDGDAELRLAIMSSIAQEESRKTSERVKWGQKRQMEQGVVFGRSMLGYDVKDGKMTINEEGAKIVRLIFHKFVNEGKGTHVIARELREEGIEPMRVKEWQNTVILRVIRNEKYCGDLVQKKTYTPDFLSHEKKYNRGQEEFVIIKDHHEPIVSRELFEEANRILDERSLSQEGKAKHSNRYPFSGKIKCGHCGASYVARYKTRKDGSKYKAWRCQEAAKHGSPHTDKAGNQIGCTGASIRNEDATHIMFLVTKELKLRQTKITKNLTSIIESIIAMDTTGTDIEKLKTQIATIEDKRTKLIDIYMSGDISKDEFSAARSKCDAEIAELQSVIDSIDKQQAMIRQQQELVQEIRDAINEIVCGVEYDDEFYKHILDKMVVNDKDNIDVYLNLLPMKWSYTVAKASKKALASERNISGASVPTEECPYLLSGRVVRNRLDMSLSDMGKLIFVCDVGNVISENKESLSSNKAAIYVYNKNCAIYEDENIKKLDDLPKYVEHSGYKILKQSGRKYFVSYLYSAKTDWTYVSFFPYSDIYGQVQTVRTLLILGFLAVFTALVFFMKKLSVVIVSPLEHLTDSMQIVENGDFQGAREMLTNTDRQDEIGTLSREFRTMLETVDTLIHENYEKQLLLKDTKYKMLRAQINPHFLYNTLNVIHWMIRAKRNEEAGRMIVELGDILHYSFSQTPYAIISDEIKMVKSYIKIQQSRYQDRIKFEIFTEGALDKYIMPRMILQPLVENAISYGAEVSLDICTITVSVRENADAIVMEVIDDGVGMSEEELEAVRSYTFKPKGHGIGLKNISERLKMDDENSIFYIDSVSGKGTNVTIKLHKRAKGDQDV